MPLPQLLSILESLDEFRELLSDLPGPVSRRGVGGLQGSSDAVVVATLSKNLTHRFFVVLNDDVAGAERWLADLSTLVEPDGVAFYPPRESFGEAEAHAEVAGERVETLERIGRGDLRIVVTTSRALL
jgi:transcription-repair coupling factor (superfamily II helicase)